MDVDATSIATLSASAIALNKGLAVEDKKVSRVTGAIRRR
jgi:hypothetical protein